MMLQNLGKQKKTFSKLKKAKNQEMIESNIQKFANFALGVHGKELPKFSHGAQKYWTFGQRYTSQPKF